MRKMLVHALAAGVLAVASMASAETPPVAAAKGRYFGVFQEIPITDITPQGWIAQYLQRQRDGLGLHRDVSGYPFDTCLWNGVIPPAKPDGMEADKTAAWDRYEQTAYLVDGLYRCGLLLQDEQLKKLGTDNIQYVLDHPSAEGKLGPAAMTAISPKLIGGAGGKDGPLPPTQWPFAVFTRALIAHYEAVHDPRLLEELTKHYLTLPDNFGTAPRDVDNVEGMLWLYGQTGDKRLVELAERTYKNFEPTNRQWDLKRLVKSERMHGHGVSVCEATKQPALLYLYTGNKEYLDAVLAAFNGLARDHELVDGVITSDAGLSGKDPDHEHETCCISDYSWSLGYVLQASGDAKWADTIERCVLNAGIGAVDKEFKSLEYYASPNQMVATNSSMTPTTGTKNREHQAYRPDFSIQCCTGNAHRFMPNYAARMFMNDGKGGIAAVMYGPATLRTQAGADRSSVTIAEKTDYPFDGAVELKITAEKPTAFPLYIRIPGWAQGATITVNGQPISEKITPATFVKIDRTFANGDTIQLGFPMNLRLETPVDNGTTITRGPLVYALKMKTDATVSKKRMRNTTVHDPNFPCWDLKPASPWNYSLALAGAADLSKIKVDAQAIKDFPWTVDGVPVVLTVPARKVPAWTLTAEGTNPPLPKAPVQLAAETEDVQLIPYGATQLRVSVFPTVGETPAAH